MKDVTAGETISQRLDFLGYHTRKDGGIWRASYTEEFSRGASYVKEWMKQAGMEVYEDAVGNVFGRVQGEQDGVILTGSHLDTVKNGGKYDGAAGVIAGIAAVGQLVKKYGTPQKTIEVVGMLEEEGSRFASSYLGSRFMTGRMDEAALDERDAEGITLRDAMIAAGYDPKKFRSAERRDIEAFVELHVEQGPRLEALGKEIGVVTSVVGVRSYDIIISGEQNHAGTTPMGMRLDPVVAAAELIHDMTDYTIKKSENAVFTVGKLNAKPGLSNVIAGSVQLSVDLRDGVDGALDDIEGELHKRALKLEQDGFGVELIKCCREEPVRFSPAIVEAVEESAKALGLSSIKMNSGAGHDAQVIGLKVPTGMIFVPSRKGISHSPDEFTCGDDLEKGAYVLRETIYRLAY